MTGQFVGTTSRVIEIDGAFYLLSIYSSQRASGGLVFCRSYLRELEVHVHQLEMSEDPSSPADALTQDASVLMRKRGNT